ncbi:golgi transport complex component Cog5 [Histoplasma capsulatum G186AR]|uniref:Conserved oligomeric Golgi complex subunit 5 n=1 Tax=Ajellomyces capsulatus TaxID=5037 RepID=A0A8H7Z8H1_AJECA|nr:golgi transport complex component Cog5 [Histoplasma capsulatum]QSS69313.1 golgi transport complex component Cog5 [Histoplasma capsulatum G186AR]
MADSEPSYIDYEAFLDPSFSPAAFANTLVTSTNNPSDTPLDLSTPLSRVLFDIQEIDTHIHTLATKSALPLLTHTRGQTDAGQRVLEAVEGQVSALREGYRRLEKDVLERWESAEEVRGAAERSWATVRLARAVGRCLVLGRQLEGQMLELTGRPVGTGPDSGSSLVVEDHRALVRASNTLLMLRRMFTTTEDEECFGLDRVKVIRTLRSDLISPAESAVKARATQIINKFSLSSLAMDTGGVGSAVGGSGTQLQAPGASTFAQAEDAKSRITSAITALYLLSPTPHTSILASEFQPELLLVTLKGYIHTCLTSSLASLSRSLSMLPTLDRTLQETSAKCQNIMAFEALLETIKPPAHPFLNYNYPSLSIHSEATTRPTSNPSIKVKDNLLQPLLQCLDTSSLPSYFWRSLASSLSTRVQEIINRGGVSARTLRSNRERLREQLRECVLRGSHLPNNSVTRLGGSTSPIVVGNWEREAAVMVSAVVGPLGR